VHDAVSMQVLESHRQLSGVEPNAVFIDGPVPIQPVPQVSTEHEIKNPVHISC